MLGDLELDFCAEEEKEVRQIKTTSPSFPGLPTVYRKDLDRRKDPYPHVCNP